MGFSHSFSSKNCRIRLKLLKNCKVSAFESENAAGNIWNHVEWDKAPREVGKAGHLGDADGWEPFKFSQCCTTLAIAPEVQAQTKNVKFAKITLFAGLVEKVEEK